MFTVVDSRSGAKLKFYPDRATGQGLKAFNFILVTSWPETTSSPPLDERLLISSASLHPPDSQNALDTWMKQPAPGLLVFISINNPGADCFIRVPRV